MSTSWDELVRALPPVPEECAEESPVRNYELLAHSMNCIVEALESKPPGEAVLGLLETGIEKLMLTTQSRDSTLFVLDEQTRELSFVVVKGSIPAEKLKWRKLARGYGIAGWVAENATNVVANDTGYDSRFCTWFDDELEYHTKTALAVPILFNGRVLGVVELLNKSAKGLFTNVDVSLATVFANLAGQSLDDLTSRGEKTIG